MKTRKHVQPKTNAQPTKWRHAIILITAVFVGSIFAGYFSDGGGAALADEHKVVMYKDPNCGCCGKWADHMRSNGFIVEEIETSKVREIQQEAGVPLGLGSCHTAKVGGYVIEGHVPAQDVKRLLTERPALAGIAVPFMPLGSPGMEGPYEAERYNVIGFTSGGATEVFSRH
ncbi:MAG: DUF411 domain-containing protein [Betaproteobacteria bacterium]|nr:DUF411 domain-containing protein [Betaproteobacteria bacterium]